MIVDAGGEKIFVVDDRGRVINDMHFLEAFVSLTVRHAPGVIAVPVGRANTRCVKCRVSGRSSLAWG